MELGLKGERERERERERGELDRQLAMLGVCDQEQGNVNRLRGRALLSRSGVRVEC